MPKGNYKNDQQKRGPVTTRKPGDKKFRVGSDPYIGLFPRTIEVGSEEDKEDRKGSVVGRAISGVGDTIKDIGRGVRRALTYEKYEKPKATETPEAKPKAPGTKTVRFRKPGSSDFGKAFSAARKASQSEFEYRGKKYTTNLKGEAPRATAPKATETPTPSTAPGPSLASRRPKPTIEEDTPPPMPKSSSFKQAFAMAKKSGEGSFTWRGKTYNTKVK